MADGSNHPDIYSIDQWYVPLTNGSILWLVRNRSFGHGGRRLSRHEYKRFGSSSRLPNYENSKLKRRERKSRSAYDFGDTNTRSLRVTLSEVTCLT